MKAFRFQFIDRMETAVDRSKLPSRRGRTKSFAGKDVDIQKLDSKSGKDNKYCAC